MQKNAFFNLPVNRVNLNLSVASHRIQDMFISHFKSYDPLAVAHVGKEPRLPRRHRRTLPIVCVELDNFLCGTCGPLKFHRHESFGALVVGE
jgi:hypothetical protein